MRRTLLGPLGGLVLAGVAVTLALVFLGQGGARPASAQPPPDPHYKCYDIVGSNPPYAMQLETQFGVTSGVAIGQATKLCLLAGKNGAPIPPGWPDLKCYTIAAQDPPHIVNLETQFGIENNVAVGQATLLCVPAAMTIVPALPAPTPPPPDRHWECFNITGSDLPDVVDLTTTEFPPENGVPVGAPTKLCAPALKNGEGSLGIPHLKCYNITGDPPAVPPVNLTTQFGIEPGLPVGPPSMLCVPAVKTVVSPTPPAQTPTVTPTGKIGGIAEQASLSGEEANAPSEDSGWSAGVYTALAGGLAALLALSAGVVYARRRWLK